MGKDLLLAHDIGTSSIKTSVINTSGEIISTYSTSLKTISPSLGYAEQKQEDWWIGIVKNTKSILKTQSGIAGKIVCIGVSGHMLGLTAVDKQGNVLFNHILHSDLRAYKEHSYICGIVGEDNLYKTTGNIPDTRSSLCKILWLKNNQPDIYNKTRAFLQSKDYVNMKMTGSIFSTDYSDASHAQFLDISKKVYCEDIFRSIGVDIGKFPSLHKSSDIIGHLSIQAAKELGLPSGIPIVAGGGDGACANVGAGAVKENDAYICLGTTAWAAYISKLPVMDSYGRIFNILSLDGETSSIFGTMSAAGKSLQWAMNLFGEESLETINKMVESVSKGSEGLIYLPYLQGERSPINDPNATGVFFGMKTIHKKEHFLRSIMEGVGYALASIMEVFRENNDFENLTIIGGGAQSAVWRQIISDIMKVNLYNTNVSAADATSFGAAIAAGVGVGIYKDFIEAVKIINLDKINSYSKKENNYGNLYSIYKKLYPSLKDSFGELRKIYKY